MAKRAFIIHGWQGSPDGNWFPWLRERLESRGFVVSVPEMPDPDYPELRTWLGKITEEVGTPDSQTYLIGHSLGCITILRYLESLGKGKIGGAILVAGFADNIGYKELNSFFEQETNWEAIRKRSGQFLVVASNDDPYVPPSYGEELSKKLGARQIVEHRMGHFNIKELHVVLNEVLRMSA